MKTTESLSLLITHGVKAATAYDVTVARMGLRAVEAKLQVSLQAAASQRIHKAAMQAAPTPPDDDTKKG